MLMAPGPLDLLTRIEITAIASADCRKGRIVTGLWWTVDAKLSVWLGGKPPISVVADNRQAA